MPSDECRAAASVASRAGEFERYSRRRKRAPAPNVDCDARPDGRSGRLGPIHLRSETSLDERGPHRRDLLPELPRDPVVLGIVNRRLANWAENRLHDAPALKKNSVVPNDGLVERQDI